jgi:curved DNA-binding protein CbpA
MNPYLVLDVPLEADDQAIRQAYLNGIKDASPDSDPKRFQALSQAYEKIKDESRRLHYALFNQECPGDSPLDVLVRYAQAQRSIPPLSFDMMKEFLQSCAAKRKP